MAFYLIRSNICQLSEVCTYRKFSKKWANETFEAIFDGES